MIFTFGDSWTAEWQEWKPWPTLLSDIYNIPTKNFAAAGNSNQQILDSVSDASLDYADQQVDCVIIAFTSIGRITVSLTNNVELCIAEVYQDSWYKELQSRLFRKQTLHSVLYNTRLKFNAIEHIVKNTWNCPVIFVPVFEDCEYWRKRNMQPSLMNICHYEEKGRYFYYDAALYELGVYQVVNEFGTDWCNNNLGPEYERAYFERTNYTMESPLFDETLHPSQQGHNAIAKYFAENLLTF